MALRDRLLANRQWYHAFKQAIRADRTMQTMVNDHIKPTPGERLLDIGCGDGDIRPLLGAVDYVGIDANEDYLRAARKQESPTTRFIVADVADLADLGVKDFDVAIAVGLLHHLSDEQANALLSALGTALKPGGRLVTFDPVFDAAQRTTARLLAALDRGRYVRDAEGYRRLLIPHLCVGSVRVRHDLLWFPYSHCVTESTTSANAT
jgi:SAM-dependent methyltransferase